MQTILRYFIQHPTAANLLMAFAIALGLASAFTIRAQFFPDVVSETATVRVVWAGAGPADVDAGIIAVLEPTLRAIDGVEKTQSLAREALGSVVITFGPGVDLDAAVADVEAAVDAVVSDLPDSAEEPTVTRGRFRDLVTNVVLSGAVSRERLTAEAEGLRDALFTSGVTRVSIEGVVDPVIRIEPDANALRRFGLSLTDLAARVRAESEALPLGSLDGGAARVRAGEDRRGIDQLAAIPVIRRVDGSNVRLDDIARLTLFDGDGPVEDGQAAIGGTGASVFFSGGDPAVRLRVDRHAAGDAIEIQRAVERVVADFQPSLPQGVEARLTQTRAQAIIDRLDILYRNGLGGLVIVLALLFLFLNARTALWVAAGVPTALLATIALMQLGGISLNMVSLFALILCLGIVVDDAIVVGEHADHLARKGETPARAALLSARRMAGPVVSASLTTIIAFGALVLIGGRFGDFVADLPRTVVAVVAASLVECFIILPAHMRHALAAGAANAWYDAPSRAVNRGFDWFRERAFRPMMSFAARLRYPVVGGVIALFLASLALRADGTVPWFFFNAPERGTIRVNVAMAHGAQRSDTFAMIGEMRRALDVVNARFADEHGDAPVIDETARIGGGVGRGLGGSVSRDADQLGGMEVELIDPDLRTYSANVFARAWEAEIQRPPLLEAISLRGLRSGPGDDPIVLEISGAADARALKAASLALQDAIAGLPGVSAVEDSMPYDKPELTIQLSRRGEALGFSTDVIASELRGRLDGVEVAQYPLNGREGRIEVRLADGARDAGFVYDTRLIAPGGGSVALADIAAVTETQGFASATRINGIPLTVVTGDIEDDAEIRAAAQAALSGGIIPEIEARYGVEIIESGLKQQERDFLNDAMIGFALGVLGIYLTLAWVFGSWRRPFVVLLAIPFGFIGAIWGHYWHDVPLSMFSVVGLIGLSGIVINDSIVLVTAIDERARRQPFRDAVLDGVCDRLRAVLLTTLTTVGGLTPLLFETSRQALFLKPTVITLAFGLSFGLIMILAVTPAFVIVQHDVGNAWRAFRRGSRQMIRRRKGLGAGRG